MDLNLLHVFAAIYRERNLTRAAENLGLTRPAVSLALRRLRDELQDPLFIRKPHGVEPTVRADTLAEKLELALSLVEEATKPTREFDPMQEDRNFVIGMSDYCMVTILPALLENLRQNTGGITLSVRHPGNEGARQALENSTFDLLIGNVQMPAGRIRQQQLLTEQFAAVVAQSHPLAHLSFDPEELNRYPALLTEGSGNYRWWENANIKSSGYNPRQIFTVPFFFGVSLLLNDSPMVFVTNRRLSRMFTAVYPVTEIPLPFDDQPIVIRQYWHERWHSDPAHRWLRQTIHSLCQKL